MDSYSSLKWICKRFLLFLFAFTILLNPQHAFAGRTVKAGVYNFKPMVYAETDGSAHGFFVDILNHVAKKENWDVQYVPGTWQEGLDRLKNDQIDLILCAGYTEVRNKYMDFPKEFLLLDWGTIYKAKGSSINNIFDLEGSTVSVLKGSEYPAGFKELAKQFHIHVTIKEMGQASEVLASVLSGTANAGVASNLSGILNKAWQEVERTPIIFSPIKLGFAVNEGKNGDLISVLDREITALKADQSSVYYQELEHMLGNKEHVIPNEAYWILAAVVAALLLAIAFIVLLRRQVKVKTEHLEVEIDERKKTEEGLKESESRWKFALEGAGDGVWDWNIQTGEAFYSQRYKAMLGFAENEIGNTSDEWLKRIHPEDASGALTSLQPYLDGKTGSASVEFRMSCNYMQDVFSFA